MDFKDKLHLILTKLEINNNMLAEELSVDVSLVSRWRTGNRFPSERNNHLDLMSHYFYKKSLKDSQLNDLFEVLGQTLPNIKPDEKNTTELIKSWLLSSNVVDNTPLIHDFINKIEFFSSSDSDTTTLINESDESYKYSTSNVYYGKQGKREAISRLLAEALLLEPTTIYIFSDEGISWLTEDITFYFSWTKMLTKLLKKGHKIRIIHTVYKSLNEILNAIEKWLPLYLSGNLEPYYYPKIQDGLFRHSMFIIGDKLALSSTSLTDKIDSSLNYYHTNKENITNLTESFNSLLEMCLPLMSIYTDKNRQGYLDTVQDFYKVCNDTYVYTPTISTVTIPYDLMGEIYENAGCSKEEAIEYQKTRVKNFKECLKTTKYSEVIPLPVIKNIAAGNVHVELTHYFPNGPYAYTKDQYRTHLLNVIKWLEEYENYHVILLDDTLFTDIRIMVKKDYGSIISKISPRPVAFKFLNKGLSDAIFEYLLYNVKEANQKSYDKNIVITKLKEILSHL